MINLGMGKNALIQTGKEKGSFSLGDPHPTEAGLVYYVWHGGMERWMTIEKLQEWKTKAALARKKKRESDQKYREEQAALCNQWRGEKVKSDPDFWKKQARRAKELDAKKDQSKLRVQKKAAQQKYYASKGKDLGCEYAAKRRVRQGFKVNKSERKEMQRIYADCRALNLAAKSVGSCDRFEVDHLWPLQGDCFTGLHVPWNLGIILKSENRSKFNKRPNASAFHDRRP